MAATALEGEGGIVSRSSIWETAPIGPDQPDYLNAVVLLNTFLGPRRLLDRCLQIELEQGRVRRERWGPRLLDLDLLLYADAVVDGPDLRIPHPRMSERRFVLAPLAEVWPGAVVPGLGVVEELLAAVADQEATRTTLDWERAGPAS